MSSNNPKVIKLNRFGTYHWMKGVSSGKKDMQQECFALIQKEAANLFLNGKDKEAERLRTLAQKVLTLNTEYPLGSSYENFDEQAVYNLLCKDE